MRISARAKNLLVNKYSMSQSERHIHAVARLLREKNPKKVTDWNAKDIILPEKLELLEFLGQKIEAGQETECKKTPSPISFIFQKTDNDKDTIYDQVLSYFDLDSETKGDIQKLFLDGALFRDLQSKRHYLVPVGDVIKDENVDNTGFYQVPGYSSLSKPSASKSFTMNVFEMLKEPLQGAMTNLIMKGLPTDQSLYNNIYTSSDVAEAGGRAIVFLSEELLKALLKGIRYGEITWMKSDEDRNWGQGPDGGMKKNSIEVNPNNSNPNFSMRDGRITFNPTLSAEMIFSLKHGQTMSIGVTFEDFFLFTSSLKQVSAAVAFPNIGLNFKFWR